MPSFKVYFALDRQRDLYRVQQIYELPGVISRTAGGFLDLTVWKRAALQGDASVKALIDDGLLNTNVTVVCLGQRTAHGKFINYEIEHSFEKGNGCVVVKINHLPHQDGTVDVLAPAPFLLEKYGYTAYKFSDKKALIAMIEEAPEIAKMSVIDRLDLHRQKDQSQPRTEKPRSERYSVAKRTVHIDGNVYPVRNCSAFGFLAATYSGARKEGEKVQITYSVSIGDRALEIHCVAVVIWIDKEKQLLGGLITEMDEESQQLLLRQFGKLALVQAA